MRYAFVVAACLLFLAVSAAGQECGSRATTKYVYITLVGSCPAPSPVSALVNGTWRDAVKTNASDDRHWRIELPDYVPIESMTFDPQFPNYCSKRDKQWKGAGCVAIYEVQCDGPESWELTVDSTPSQVEMDVVESVIGASCESIQKIRTKATLRLRSRQVVSIKIRNPDGNFIRSESIYFQGVKGSKSVPLSPATSAQGNPVPGGASSRFLADAQKGLTSVTLEWHKDSSK